MGIEEGARSPGNTECAEGVQCLKRKAISDEVPVSNGNGVVEEARSKSDEVKDGAVISNGNCVVEEARCSKSEEVNDGVVISNGNGVSEEVRHLESEAMSDEVPISNGNGVVEEAQHLESEAMSSDEAVSSNGNGVAEEVRHSKSEVVNDGAVLMNVNGVAEVNEVLKSDGLNNGVNVNGVTEEDGGLKNEPINNGAAISDGFDSGDGGSCGVTCLRTYKRRKYDKSSSKGKAQEDYKKCVETASDIADQVAKEPFDEYLGNYDDSGYRHWGYVVLKHLHQSIGSVNGGIGEAQIDRLSHRTRTEANGYAPVLQNGSSSESHGHGGTEMCQRMLCEVLTSHMFNSLCNTLLENFQGTAPESVVDFSAVILKMKKKYYENSPELFLSDIQQVWRKLQNTSNKIFALSKGLLDLSSTCYSELVGNSAQSTSEDEKQVESDAHMKPEETEEWGIYKICCCSCCREKIDGTDCLVCDSCEKVYHLSCIEPAVKEIPHKSWYCANCTTNGIGSPHENCVVCARLNGKKTPKKTICDESLPTNEEFEENSNSRYDEIQVSIRMRKTPHCKVCANEVDVKDEEEIRMCGHPYCSKPYYHVRCLTNKQLNMYSYEWYCPSCLCQACLTNKDDDRIVLCDGCDHGTHIYCMKPPRNSIPQGKWFCRKCEAGIKAISQAKKAYESNKLRTGKYISKTNANNKNNCSNICVEESESVGGMDMLLTAANCLNFEENLSKTQFE